MVLYAKVPNPKYAISDKPELPMASVNAVYPDGKLSFIVGRQYKCSKTGKEVTIPFIERDGLRKYISEMELNNLLAKAWNALP